MSRKTVAKKSKKRLRTASAGRHWWQRETGQDLLWAAGLTLLAWVHRIFFLLSNRDRDWPFTIFYQGDAQTFFLHARALLAGELYDEGIPFHPPGFPYLLSWLHSFFGAGAETATVPHRSIKIMLALIASFAVGLLFLLAKPYVGRLAAALASLLVTYHFGHYVISIAPVGEGVYVTLLLAALLLWSRRFDHALAAPSGEAESRGPSHRLRDGLLLGVLTGALTLLRAESILIVLLLVSIGLWRWGSEAWRIRVEGGRPTFERLAPWLLVGVGAVLVIAPWTWRNYRALSDFNQRMAGQLEENLPTFVPVTIYGPINLALANQASADGSFSPEALTGDGGASLDLTRGKHLEWLLHGDRIAWDWISQHPGDFASLVIAKWRLSAQVFSLGFLQENWPAGLDGIRRPVDLFVPDERASGWWWLPLLAVGAVLAWRRRESRRYLFVTALVTLCWLAVTALFYGYVRLALLYLPLWAVLAVLPVAELLHKAWKRLSPPAWSGIAFAAVFIGGLLVGEWIGASADRNYKASASSTVDGHHLNPDDEIRLELIDSE